MERLKAWFGWRPEQTSPISFQGSKILPTPPDDKELKQGEITLPRTANSSTGQPEKNSLITFHVNKWLLMPPGGSPQKQGESTQVSVATVSPQQPEQNKPEAEFSGHELRPECMECKVIGCSALFFATVYILYSGIKTRKQYAAGYKRVLYTLQYSTLAIGMTTVAISRAFNLGPFARHKINDEYKPLIDYINEDIQFIKDKYENLTSSTK